jgi:hypothetical protein
MPEATEYPTDLNSQAYKTIEEAYQEEAARRGEFLARSWAYYDGEHKPPLKIQQDGYDDNIILNEIEIFADKLETMLVGDGLKFDAAGDDQTTETDEQITDLWKQNRGEILQANIALAGVLEGHLAVRLTPVDGLEWPRLQRVRQAHFSAFWDPFDLTQVNWYRLQGNNRRIDYVQGRLTEGEIDQAQPVWTEFTYEAVGTDIDALGISKEATKWELANIQEWPYEFPPIVDWQNLPNPNWYYGRADVISAIRLNDALNFLVSNLNRIIKYFASPRTVGTGFTADDVMPTQVGGLWTIENPEAKVTNLEMQSDASLSRWLADVLFQTLWQSGGLVDPQTTKDKIGQLTNFGLRVLFSDAIGRIAKKRRLYGEGLDKIIDWSFILAGLAPPESVTIIWPDVLPEDNKAEMETLTAEYDRGLISKETYRDRRDYDHEMEETRIADEQTESDLGSLLLQNARFNRGQ